MRSASWPSADEVRELDEAAFGAIGDSGAAPAAVAMYGYFPSRPGSLPLTERDAHGRLIGFAYGYPDFGWSTHTTDWDDLLRESLGGEDERLVGAFTVMHLAVHPAVQGRGIGRSLLRELVARGALDDSGAPSSAWLATRDGDTAAQSLYASDGWSEIGRGPLGGPGSTAVVLLQTPARRIR